MAEDVTTKFSVDGQHFIKDTLFPRVVSIDVLDQIRKLDIDGDILITSYPKCGSIWLQEIVWLIQKDGDTREAESSTLSSRIPYLEMLQSSLNSHTTDTVFTQPHPRIFKSHLGRDLLETSQLSGENLKILIPIRNPKDTLVSYYHFYRINILLGKFSGTWDEFFELFKLKRLFFGDFFDWYEKWWTEFHDDRRVLFVRYEDMKRDLKAEVRRVARFLNKSELSDDVIAKICDHCSFKTMKDNKMTNYTHLPPAVLDQNVSPFMRKGEVGDWKNYFRSEQSEYVNALYEERFKKIGLHLDFEI